MEITLIRHGRSQLDAKKSITFQEFLDWVNQYNSRGVVEETHYPQEAVKKMNEANLVITSDLKRSIDSAYLLRKNVKAISSSLFRELELPVTTKSFPSIKLSSDTWAVLLRILWFSGYSANCESYKSAKQRAELAANKIMELTTKHQNVVLIGHGFFNRLLAKELQNKGWKRKTKITAKHWGAITFTNHV
ncbi:histidine phosphatase family protein [Metabacillus litoralis]|uniref:histidine phosphatase family protein n=1 Tax=Metabacillus TaxID=2675233 RepID=UPI000EF61EDF|nr:histidine phosphatase family protein [Metabacillus litoralis]MCM3163966.1 histidine phosphatase family protein [Metabacillus litoralis]UHA58442.1 histidine phosphatase family protein [Metabacillus litoralis]